MISISVIITIFFIVFTLIFLFRKKGKSIVLPNWIVLISVFILLIGLVHLFWQESEINKEMSKRKWNVVIGEIVESKIIGERALRTEIKYQYVVNDIIYDGESDFNIPGFGGKNYRRKNAKIVKNENPIGSKIKVYFNPNDPQISTLRYGPYWSNYMILGFGSFLLLIGMFILGWQLFTKYILKEK